MINSMPNKYETLALLMLQSRDLSNLSSKEVLNMYNKFVHELKKEDNKNVKSSNSSELDLVSKGINI